MKLGAKDSNLFLTEVGGGSFRGQDSICTKDPLKLKRLTQKTITLYTIRY